MSESVNRRAAEALIAGLLDSQSVVAYRPDLGRALGSAQAALFLCQAIYWQKIAGWGNFFYKNRLAERDKLGRMLMPGTLVAENRKVQQSWEWELALGRSEQECARKILRAVGLLEERRFGLPAQNHYRVNNSKLIEFLLKNQKIADSSLLDGGNQPTGERETAGLPAESCPEAETSPEIFSEIRERERSGSSSFPSNAETGNPSSPSASGPQDLEKVRGWGVIVPRTGDVALDVKNAAKLLLAGEDRVRQIILELEAQDQTPYLSIVSKKLASRGDDTGAAAAEAEWKKTQELLNRYR